MTYKPLEKSIPILASVLIAAMHPMTTLAANEQWDSGANIMRAMSALADRQESAGLMGVKESITDCYNESKKKKNAKVLQYCFAADFGASNLDEGVSEIMGIEPDPFLRPGNVLARVNAGLKELGYDQDERGIIIAKWSQLTIAALNLLWHD